VFLNGIGGSRRGEMCKMTQMWAAQNAKGRSKCGQNTNLLSDPRSGVRLIAEEQNMGICSGEMIQTVV
jgi:hypothetical protein